MKLFIPRLLSTGLVFVLIVGLTNVRMQADDKKSKDKSRSHLINSTI